MQCQPILSTSPKDLATAVGPIVSTLASGHGTHEKISHKGPSRLAKFLFGGVLCSLILAISACSNEPVPIPLKTAPSEAVDFSGSWELNYQLSDRVEENAELLQLIAIARARRANSRYDRRPFPVLPSLELVQLADAISQTQVVEIEQDEFSIEVNRDDDFPLTCDFDRETAYGLADALGSEVCGWDSHQLVFGFALPDSLSLIHI